MGTKSLSVRASKAICSLHPYVEQTVVSAINCQGCWDSSQSYRPNYELSHTESSEDTATSSRSSSRRILGLGFQSLPLNNDRFSTLGGRAACVGCHVRAGMCGRV